MTVFTTCIQTFKLIMMHSIFENWKSHWRDLKEEVTLYLLQNYLVSRQPSAAEDWWALQSVEIGASKGPCERSNRKVQKEYRVLKRGFVVFSTVPNPQLKWYWHCLYLRQIYDYEVLFSSLNLIKFVTLMRKKWCCKCVSLQPSF